MGFYTAYSSAHLAWKLIDEEVWWVLKVISIYAIGSINFQLTSSFVRFACELLINAQVIFFRLLLIASISPIRGKQWVSRALSVTTI